MTSLNYMRDCCKGNNSVLSSVHCRHKLVQGEGLLHRQLLKLVRLVTLDKNLFTRLYVYDWIDLVFISVKKFIITIILSNFKNVQT